MKISTIHHYRYHSGIQKEHTLCLRDLIYHSNGQNLHLHFEKFGSGKGTTRCLRNMAHLNYEKTLKFVHVPGFIDRIENILFHNKFHFWTWAINRIKNLKKKIFSSNSI